MNNTRSALSMGLLLGFALTACETSVPDQLSDEDVAAIRSVTQAWAVAMRIGDGGSIGLLFTEDAVEMPPDASEHEGRRAIQIRVEMTGRNRAAFAVTSLETEGRGDLAFDRGTYSLTEQGIGREEDTVETGTYLAILQRQADGSWLIFRLIWTKLETTDN